MNSNGIAVDDTGHSYVTGSFSGTARFGSTLLTSFGDTDMYLIKVNSLGEVIWAQSGGGAFSDVGRGVAVDADGNVYVTGSTRGPATFGSVTLPGDFSENVFLAKYNSAGALQWVRSGGGTGNDDAFAVALDGAGNPVIGGFFMDTAVFGSLPPLVSAGGHDIFIASYTASGDEQWAIRAGGAGFGYQGEGAQGLAIDDAGDIYVAGNFVGNAQFGSFSVSSEGSQDVFVAKYSPSAASWQWVAQGGGFGEDRATALALDPAGNVYIAGIFTEIAFFEDTMLTASTGFSWINQDYFVAKYDSAGALQWVRESAGVGSYAGHGLAVDADSNVYLAATFDGTAVVGDATLTSGGNDNIYIAKYDPDGANVWVVQSGGDFFNIAGDIAVDAAGSLYLTGWFLGTAEFGETTLSHSAATAVSVAKLGVASVEIPILSVGFDIRPGSEVNPLQPKSKGVLPVAILGDADFDVAAIDLSTVAIWRTDGIGGAVAPLARPGPSIKKAKESGIADLHLKISVEELVQTLELSGLPRDTEVELAISGALLDGSEFAGVDTVWLR